MLLKQIAHLYENDILLSLRLSAIDLPVIIKKMITEADKRKSNN